MAGPNGVGTMTFAREFLPKFANCKNFVNADLIAQETPYHEARGVSETDCALR